MRIDYLELQPSHCCLLPNCHIYLQEGQHLLCVYIEGLCMRLDPLVKGIHNEQREKKVSRNDISILFTVGQIYKSSCQLTQDK